MNFNIDKKSLGKLTALDNKYVSDIISEYASLCKPEKVTVLTDTVEDRNYVKELSIKNKEEIPLKTPGHTVHFDGINDQGRDLTQTKVLLSDASRISKYINTGERKTCLTEIRTLLEGIMKGKEMLLLFFCLGPNNSGFSIPALQITDSFYVAHSENLLYRPGYNEFQKLKDKENFFHFVHSAGILEYGKSRNTEDKRIYVDIDANRVFSVNTQYAGNSVGLKKLALRLAIKKSSKSDWLCEHMFLSGVKRKNKKRVTYFAGAFPSACGKTSTAMIEGNTIIGDDIVYIKPGKNGKALAVNVEQGIFGIIQDINPKDDPLIYEVLTTKRELIFSNILINDKKPYWLGMGKKIPSEGLNYSGLWKKGKCDNQKNEILPAHKNARYTVKIKDLPNVDANMDNPRGVPLSGIIYGGRDSDTSPPVVESFNWAHGVFMGASLESETTAATLGITGIRKHNPMSNMDFLVIPLKVYLENHLKFGKNLKKLPLIFTTNYFLSENGKFLNGKSDKKIWLEWMEGRVHDEYDVMTTPIGYIPHYQDLKDLFWEIFRKVYEKSEYEKQFTIRISKLLDKLDRVEKIFMEEKGILDIIFQLINEQRKRLIEAKEKYQKNNISPFSFE
jgi:phosphoenolpyruvate carboxykinase (GTP)